MTENFKRQTSGINQTKRFAHYDLGGACDGLASSVAATDHHLLGEEDLFSGDLNTQVAAGNHDAIAGLHDLIESAHSGKEMTMAQFPSPWFSEHFEYQTGKG